MKPKLTLSALHMKAFLSVAFISLTAAILQGAPMVSVTCSAPLSASVSSSGAGSAGCTSFANGQSYAGGGATATAQVNLQLATSAADFSSLSTYQSAYARQGPRPQNEPFGPAAGNFITINFSDTLVTAGASRSGYLQIQGYGSGASFYDGGASMTSGLLLNGAAATTEISCYSNSSYCTPGTGYYNTYTLIPVTLGTAITIEANGHTNNSASAFDGSSGGSLSTTYQFRFLEADGVTPVSVSEAPEPATLGLLSLSCGAILVARKRRKTRTPKFI